MESQLTKWRNNRSLFPAISLAVLGALLVLLRGITYGPGMEADSVGYVSAAKNFSAGNGFVFYDGAILTQWPPLFPILLSAGIFLTFDPVSWAGLLNATFFGTAGFIASRWLQRHLKEPSLVLLGTLAILLSPCLTTQASRVMSDSTFILFALGSLIEIENFLVHKRTAPLVRAAILTGFACLTRYIGVTLVCTGIFLLLLTREKTLEKIRHVVTYSFIAIMPTGVWLLRNALLSEPIVGGRGPSDSSLVNNLYNVTGVLTSWLIPGFSPIPWLVPGFPPSIIYSVSAGILLLAVSTAIIGACIRMLRNSETEPGRRLAIVVYGSFAAIYLSFLVAAATLVAFNWIDDRLLSPVYIPLVFVGATVVDWWLFGISRKSASASTWCRRGLFLWLVYLVLINTWNIHFAIRHGTDRYTSKPWHDSDLMRFIGRRLSDLPNNRIWSNDPWAVFVHTDIFSSFLTYKEVDLPKPLRRIQRNALVGGDVYLIWWHQPPRPGHPADYSITEMEEEYLPTARRVQEDPDGIVYHVSAGSVRERLAKDIQKAGKPVIRSVFNVYYTTSTLIYSKDSCTQEEESMIFFLHVIPIDTSDLSDSRKRLGFDVLDFPLNTYGGNVGGRCLAQVPLPEYPIAKVITGQAIPNLGHVWEESFDVMETAENHTEG